MFSILQPVTPPGSIPQTLNHAHTQHSARRSTLLQHNTEGTKDWTVFAQTGKRNRLSGMFEEAAVQPRTQICTCSAICISALQTRCGGVAS